MYPPTVDGERLYVEGLAGNVACSQVSDGKILWQAQYDGGFRRLCAHVESYRESPLIDGDKVTVIPAGPMRSWSP